MQDRCRTQLCGRNRLECAHHQFSTFRECQKSGSHPFENASFVFQQKTPWDSSQLVNSGPFSTIFIPDAWHLALLANCSAPQWEHFPFISNSTTHSYWSVKPAQPIEGSNWLLAHGSTLQCQLRWSCCFLQGVHTHTSNRTTKHGKTLTHCWTELSAMELHLKQYLNAYNRGSLGWMECIPGWKCASRSQTLHVTYFLFWKVGGLRDLIQIKGPCILVFFFAYPLVSRLVLWKSCRKFLWCSEIVLVSIFRQYAQESKEIVYSQSSRIGYFLYTFFLQNKPPVSQFGRMVKYSYTSSPVQVITFSWKGIQLSPTWVSFERYGDIGVVVRNRKALKTSKRVV